MSELDKLLSSLFQDEAPKLLDIKFFPGDNPELTADDISREANRAQLAHSNGLSAAHSILDETDLKTIDFRNVKNAKLVQA